MPKTRLTARLCSTPTQKSPSSVGPPPVTTPTAAAISPPTKLSALPPSAPKSPSASPAVSLALSPTKPSSSKPPPPPPTPPPPTKPPAAKPVPRATSSRTAAKLAASESSKGEPALVFSKSPPVPLIPYDASSMDFSIYRDACDSVSDSDSDQDDLPDAVSFSETGSWLPAKGDAVWVKHRSQNFWPTLVIQSNARSKKLHVLFLDDTPINGQHSGKKVYLKYSKQKVLPYNHENKNMFEAEGKSLESAELRKQFQAALSKMGDYLTKRALGHKAACKAFFNEPVSSEDEEEAKTKQADPPPPSPSTPVPATKMQSTPAKRKRKKAEGTEEEGGEKLAADDSLTSTKNRRKKVMTPSERRAMRKAKNQPVVDFICSPDMKNHLAKIYRGEAPSKQHLLFKQGCSQREKVQSKYLAGPIDDEEQLDAIITFIGDYYRELTHHKLPNMDYLFCVWLPEAIIYAITKVKRCGQKKAGEIFDKGVKLTKSEHLEIHDQLTRR